MTGWQDDGSGEGPVLLHPLLRHGVARHVGVVDTALWNIRSQLKDGNMWNNIYIYNSMYIQNMEKHKCDKCVFWIYLCFKTLTGYDILSLQKSQDFEVVNIRNISILLKVHSFRKTEIKPILFFEPINDQRPGVFHQSRTGCCQKTRDFGPAPSHSGLVWWNVDTNTCTDSQRHVYRQPESRAGPLQCN